MACTTSGSARICRDCVVGGFHIGQIDDIETRLLQFGAKRLQFRIDHAQAGLAAPDARGNFQRVVILRDEQGEVRPLSPMAATGGGRRRIDVGAASMTLRILPSFRSFCLPPPPARHDTREPETMRQMPDRLMAWSCRPSARRTGRSIVER